MSSVEEHLNKLREERIAREKARIEKLRELNLKKYSKTEAQTTLKPTASVPVNRPVKIETNCRKLNVSSSVRNNFNISCTTKRPVTAPLANGKTVDGNKKMTVTSQSRTTAKTDNKRNIVRTMQVDIKPTEINIKQEHNKENTVNKIENKPIKAMDKNIGVAAKNYNKFNDSTVVNDKQAKKIEKNHKMTDKIVPNSKTDMYNARKTINVAYTNLLKSTPGKNVPAKQINRTTLENSRKSLQPKPIQNVSKLNPNRQSVFERLYQPKAVQKKELGQVEKLQTNPDYLKKVIKNSGLIFNNRQSFFEPKKAIVPVRRSISAVHFKRISKNEIGNCIHKWASMSEKLDKINLKDEDDAIKEDKVVSAIKSDRKKVKFQAPTFNFNTPKPEELQARLQNWLQKRGKSLDSYHHLQCFGIHHLSNKLKPINLEETTNQFEEFDDEDKENVPLESDSDNDSYDDNMNDRQISDNKESEKDVIVKQDNIKELNDIEKTKWRNASYVSDSVDFNETQDSFLTETTPRVDELLLGALNDLTELLREGFEWEQCARWLRAIRERYPEAPESAAYWECRAALEERRGDLPTSIHCWEEAIAKGTERSVVEANLDQLLDKFMQLKISPSGKGKQADPKMIDVKNIFKSTIIRFAVQQAKLRQSNQHEAPKFICTPVRRSGRLSSHWSEKRTPLRVCTTIKQASLLGHPVVFVPNDKLSGTP